MKCRIWKNVAGKAVISGWKPCYPRCRGLYLRLRPRPMSRTDAPPYLPGASHLYGEEAKELALTQGLARASPWGPYFSWYSSPAPQVAPGLLGVINQRAAAPLHRPESSALGCALWRTRLVEKVDLPISASLGGVPATCMGAVLQTMISLG